MAELDKKSEATGSMAEEQGESAEIAPPADSAVDAETPRRSKKPDRARSKDKHKKQPPKHAAGARFDGGRLRSSR